MSITEALDLKDGKLRPVYIEIEKHNGGVVGPVQYIKIPKGVEFVIPFVPKGPIARFVLHFGLCEIEWPGRVENGELVLPQPPVTDGTLVIEYADVG